MSDDELPAASPPDAAVHRDSRRFRARVAAIAVALVSAAFGLRALATVRAERAYERGIDLAIDRPDRDLPGRLEAYDEAGALEPGEATYALRAAQIRLTRLQRAAPADRGPLLAAARDAIGRALSHAPLDPRVQIAAAQVAQSDGDVVLARDRADAAALLGPRHPGALAAAVRVHLWAWRRSGDPEALVRALEVAGDAQALADDPAPGAERATTAPAAAAIAAAFRGGSLTAADVVAAAGSRADLRELAARVHPDPAAQTLLRDGATGTGEPSPPR